MDFETRYEEYQASIKAGVYSGFAPEDLPSDYIGFWAAINGYEYNEIPSLLESLGPVEEYPGPSMVFNITPSSHSGGTGVSPARNYEFTPMALSVTPTPLGPLMLWQNVSWPTWMQPPNTGLIVEFGPEQSVN